MIGDTHACVNEGALNDHLPRIVAILFMTWITSLCTATCLGVWFRCGDQLLGHIIIHVVVSSVVLRLIVKWDVGHAPGNDTTTTTTTNYSVVACLFGTRSEYHGRILHTFAVLLCREKALISLIKTRLVKRLRTMLPVLVGRWEYRCLVRLKHHLMLKEHVIWLIQLPHDCIVG